MERMDLSCDDGQGPKTLVQIASEKIWKQLPCQMLEKDLNNTQLWKGKSYKLKDQVMLPKELWESFLEHNKQMTDDRIWLMLALNKINLNKINLDNATNLTDEVLEKLICNFPKELNIHNCPTLTCRTFKIINKYGKNLETLKIGSSIQVLPTDVVTGLDYDEVLEENDNSIWGVLSKNMPRFFRTFRHTINLGSEHEPNDTNGNKKYQFQQLETPKLKTFAVWGLHVRQKQHVPLSKFHVLNPMFEDLFEKEDSTIEMDYWSVLMESFIHNLIHLDLSYCQEFLDLNFILKASGLQQLSLHDVLIPPGPGGWAILTQLTNLTYLDLSQSVELAAVYTNPDDLLQDIVKSLKKLRALDISGTNLAGNDAYGIGGLSFLKKPLDFLGLLGTHGRASKRPYIPAIVITGTANSIQLLKSLKLYIHRPDMLKKALRMLYFELSNNNRNLIGADFTPRQVLTFLEIVLEVCELHIRDKHVLITSLCVIFNLVKRWKDVKPQVNADIQSFEERLKKRVIKVVMHIMEKYSYDLTLLRNAFLIYCFFDATQYFEGEILIRLVNMLLQAIDLALENSDTFLLRTSFFLLKPLCILSEIENKSKLGDVGVIGKTCVIIETLLKNNISDHLSAAWMILECLTDDHPKNAVRFAKHGGLELFVKFKETKPINQVLTRAMGVLVNLACTDKAHEYFFPTPKYINDIYELITAGVYQEDDMNCSDATNDYHSLQYAAVACLVHLSEQEDSKWEDSKEGSTKTDILWTVENVIESWNETFDMQIEYTSLKSILKSLNSSVPQCKLFAVWTLANLTCISPEVYIKMLGNSDVFLSSCIKIIQDENQWLCGTMLPLINQIIQNVTNFRTISDADTTID